MQVIRTRNVHEALPKGIFLLRNTGVKNDSRNGPVIVSPEPVTTVYENPRERVMFHEKRNCNPFFHLMESLWMMAGRNDVEYVARFVKRMKEFSDDGEIFNGAYGFRWRQHFGYDQLFEAVSMLKEDPTTRRVVVQMWDADDLNKKSKDLPCNTNIYFSILDGKLDMTVCNRSNDMIWGAYGANAVHMSFLLEVMAAAVGVGVGIYYQMSNNFHAYEEVFKENNVFLGNEKSPYSLEEVDPFNIVNGSVQIWFEDLQMFLEEGANCKNLRDRFFRRVAMPMLRAHTHYKDHKDAEGAIKILKDCLASDWRRASIEWLERRQKGTYDASSRSKINQEKEEKERPEAETKA